MIASRESWPSSAVDCGGREPEDEEVRARLAEGVAIVRSSRIRGDPPAELL
jgi:hypothetical protein